MLQASDVEGSVAVQVPLGDGTSKVGVEDGIRQGQLWICVKFCQGGRGGDRVPLPGLERSHDGERIG